MSAGEISDVARHSISKMMFPFRMHPRAASRHRWQRGRIVPSHCLDKRCNRAFSDQLPVIEASWNWSNLFTAHHLKISVSIGRCLYGPTSGTSRALIPPSGLARLDHIKLAGSTSRMRLARGMFASSAWASSARSAFCSEVRFSPFKTRWKR